MQGQTQTRKLSLHTIAGISAAVAVLTASAGTAWWTWNSSTPNSPGVSITPSQTTPTLTQTPPNVAPAQQQQQQEVPIYWLATEGNNIKVVSSNITLGANEDSEVLLKDAFQGLLIGPKDAQKHVSTIPEGTKLRDLEVKTDGIHIDLSKEFTSGGGSASMTGRLAQILYTASSLDPNAKIWINVDGEPLEVLGGEGILVDQPMTRQDFEANFEL